MANKPLQSLKFPGLPDTYVVPQVDNTLTLAGKPADAKKVGDEITNVKSDLSDTGITNILYKSDFIHRDSHTSNGITFTKINDCKYSIAGTATASTVQNFYDNTSNLPADLKVGKKYLLLVDGVSANCQFRISFYTDEETDFIYSSNGKYEFTVPQNASGAVIRFFIPNGSSVDTTCTVGIYVFEDNYSIPDIYSKLDVLDALSEDVEDCKQFTGYDFTSLFQWEQGGYGAINNFSTPNINGSSTRIHAQIIVPVGKYIVLRVNPLYQFVWATFDNDGQYLEGAASWQSSEKHMAYNAKYIRLALRKTDNGNIVPSEGLSSGITVVSYESSPIKLKVMTYNIGRYSHGTSPYYLDTDYDTKVNNLKRFLSSEKCDLIGLQEANTYLDGATSGSKSANGVIFNFLYPYCVNYPENTSLKSKVPLIDRKNGTLSTGRPKSEAKIEIYGKEIYLLCVHLTPNAGSSQETARATERAEIIAEMGKHQYAICFGDFNAQQFADFNDFTDAGLKIANGGYMEKVNTYGGLTVFQELLPMDNIVVTPNIIIDDSKRLDVFSDLVSDHVPFIAHLTVI